jgi:flagellar protein FliO/FliZ
MTNASVLGLIARLVVSLTVVLGLMMAAAWVLRRRGGSLVRAGKAGVTEVMARQSLTKSSSVQVVRIGDRALVLGVTEQSITYLTEADADEFRAGTIDVRGATAPTTDASGTQRTVPQGSATRSGSTRTGFIEALREKTTRQ